MLPLNVLSCLSSRLYYLQYNVYLTFPLPATLARNESTMAANGNNIAKIMLRLILVTRTSVMPTNDKCQRHYYQLVLLY